MAPSLSELSQRNKEAEKRLVLHKSELNSSEKHSACLQKALLLQTEKNGFSCVKSPLSHLMQI